MSKAKLYKKMTKENTALIVIDIINSCASKKCEIEKWDITFSKIRKIVPRLNNFLNKYREEINKNVFLINGVPWQEEFLPRNMNELYQHNSGAKYYSENKSGFVEEFFNIKPVKTDTIFTKNTYSAFADRKLDKILKERKIKYLIIAGVFGDACVMATVAGAFASGYSLVMLKDLIETTDVSIRQKIQEGLKKYTWPYTYGDTINSDNFLKYWSNEKTERE